MDHICVFRTDVMRCLSAAMNAVPITEGLGELMVFANVVVLKTLQQLSEVLGADRQASVSREISKVHEETVRGSLQELTEHFSQNPPKGEIVLCVAGNNQ